MPFGIRPSFVRETWPNQRRSLCLSKVYMEVVPCLSNTVLLNILSLQKMPKIRLRQRMWKEFSLARVERRVHNSLP